KVKVSPRTSPANQIKQGDRKREKGGWNIKKESSSHLNLKTCPAANSCKNKPIKLISYENNMYHPQPVRKFSALEAQKVMRSVLEEKLKHVRYDEKAGARLTVDLAESVKDAVRALGYERYKLVCYVVLGAVRRSEISCCSRSVWSPVSDTYAEYCFKNDSLFALCIVFAVYYE
uniref:Tctex1 domain containing 1 n=2 Tax=Latimeria chalumnae TaxID=7897 RepID=H3B061_LATCH